MIDSKPFINEAQRSVLQPVVSLLKETGWSAPSTNHYCSVSELTVPYLPQKVFRIQRKYQCSLDAFETVISDEKSAKATDNMLEDFTVLDDRDGVYTIYTSYKQPAPFVSPRDFVVRTARARLGREEQEQLGLSPAHEALFLSASAAGDDACRPPVRGKVRGRVNVFGYAAVETSEGHIDVTNFMSVDPAGNIPAFAVAAGVTGQAVKLNTLLEMSSKVKVEKKKPPVEAPPLSAEQTPSPVTQEEEAVPPPSSEPIPAEKTLDTSPTAPLEEAKQHLNEAQRSVLQPVVSLLKETGWSASSTNHYCSVSELTVPYLPQKVFRIQRKYQCSLDAFETVISDEKSAKATDNMLEDFTVLDDRDGVYTIYTSYKQPAPFVSPRDFVVRTARARLGREEQEQLGLSPAHEALFLSASAAGDDACRPPVRGKVRGRVNVFGYAAVETSEGHIDVTNFMSVDPAGNIPAFAVAAGVTGQAVKLNTLLEMSSKVKAEKKKPPVEAPPLSAEQTPSPVNQEEEAVPPPSSDPVPVDPNEEGFNSTLSQSVASMMSMSEMTTQEEHNSRIVFAHEFNNFVDFARQSKWVPYGNLSSSEYDVETAEDFPASLMNGALKRKNVFALRIQTKFNCTLGTFSSMMSTSEGKEQATLRSVKSADKGEMRLYVYDGTYPFDLSLQVGQATLGGEDGSVFGLYTTGMNAAAYVEYGKNNREGFIYDPVDKHFRIEALCWGTYAVAIPRDASVIRVIHCFLLDLSDKNGKELSAFQKKTMQMKLVQSSLLYFRELKKRVGDPTSSPSRPASVERESAAVSPAARPTPESVNPVITNFLENVEEVRNMKEMSCTYVARPRCLIRVQVFKRTEANQTTSKIYLFSTCFPFSATQWTEVVGTSNSLYRFDSAAAVEEQKEFSNDLYKTFSLKKYNSVFSFMETTGVVQHDGHSLRTIARSNYTTPAVANNEDGDCTKGTVLLDGLVMKEFSYDGVTYANVYRLVSFDTKTTIPESVVVESECKALEELRKLF